MGLHIVLGDKEDNFLKLYSEYVNWCDEYREIDIPDRDGNIESLVLDSMRNHQMQVSCTNVVFYINMSQAVFENLRPYLMKHDKLTYDKIDWSRRASSIIEDVYKSFQ